MYETSSEKFEYIISHENFGVSMPFFKDKAFIRAVKKMSQEELRQTFDEITELYKSLPKVSYNCDKNGNYIYVPVIPISQDIADLVILKANMKESYDYLFNLSNKKELARLLRTFRGRFSGSGLETLTIPQIRQISGRGNTCNLSGKTDPDIISDGCGALERYVESSDIFVENPQNIRKLSTYLSHFTITEPFTAFRAERDTGMFDSVLLDKKTAMITKWLALKNIFKTKKIQIHGYNGQYETSFAKKQNLFDYIWRKEKLTLADGMQMAKYGGTSYVSTIIEMIKKSKIKDSRFKSLTFDKCMAESWLLGGNSCNTAVIHDLTVHKRLQGIYSHVNNRQAEFILNNNEKTITFQDVVYDRVKDIFRVVSSIT